MPDTSTEILDTLEPMPDDNVELGQTGIHVSALGLGAWSWGDRWMWGYGQGYGEQDVRQAFRTSLAAGVNFVDTAEMYGRGSSERYLGQFVSETQRHLVTVATKFAPLPWRLRRGSLLDALHRSLERLQLRQVDLYQIHFPLPPIAITTWLEALADAVEQGLTRAAGVSNYNLKQTRQAFATLAARGVPLASNQMSYSLLDRAIEHNGVMDFCRDKGITIIAYSPLAMGMVTGKYTPENPPSGMRARRYSKQFLARIAPLNELLRELGTARGKSGAQVALNWVICKGAVPIPGAKNARHAADNAGALGWRLDEGEIRELDEVSERVSGKR